MEIAKLLQSIKDQQKTKTVVEDMEKKKTLELEETPSILNKIKETFSSTKSK